MGDWHLSEERLKDDFSDEEGKKTGASLTKGKEKRVPDRSNSLGKGLERLVHLKN